MHPVLADILWTNLFQNAIRHNIENGKIRIELTNKKLVIANTGEDPEVDTDQLFERFRKAEQSSESIGLGLSIIKRIVDQSHLTIMYTYADNWHRIVIGLR
jgi:signal transduction histidine kinase